MSADSLRRATEADVAQVLYGQDLMSFFTHWFAICVLTAIYYNVLSIGRGALLIWAGLYALINIGNLALWALHRWRGDALSPHAWINVHAVRGLLLYSAPGWSIWFAYASGRVDLPMLHSVLLVMLAAGVFMSNGFDWLNYVTAVPPLLVPSIVLHLRSGTPDGLVLGGVLLVFLALISVYTLTYRRLMRRVVVARVDQQRLAESLAVQKRVAEEANASKTRFFAAASHDLRQPLHAISLLAASLSAHAQDEREQRDTVANIVSNVDALNRLFNQVLDLARIESGMTQVLKMHFRLSELFDRVEGQFRPIAASKGLALRIAPTHAVVCSDPVLLERVLGNLLSNAIRYTESGAIWMGYRAAGDTRVGYIEVRDSGMGIAQADQERIFEEYYQVANPQRDASQGHGLGLPTVRRLVTLLGGQLTLRSAPGRGSTFRFSIEPGDLTRVQVSNGDDVLGASPADGQRVLCIDDEPSIRDGVGRLLRQWGCEIVAVADEADAVKAIDGGFIPELVICDYKLAHRRTGVEALDAVRSALGRHGRAPARELLLTGDMASPELSQAASRGIVVLHKPLAPARLRRALQAMRL